MSDTDGGPPSFVSTRAACEACGARLAGTVTLDPRVDETVLCETCAPANRPYGVHVRPRVDDLPDRWQPGDWHGRMDP